MEHPTRRFVIGSAMVSGLTIGLGLSPGNAETRLHLLSWGWGYDTAIKDVVEPEFKTPGVDLEIGTNAANYTKLLAQRSNPVLSGGMFNGIFSNRGRDDDLWVPIARNDIPNPDNLIPSAFIETGGIVFGAQPYGIVYNPNYVEKPTSWLTLFDPKYKGKVGLSDFYFDGFGMTAKAMGKSVNDVQAGISAWAQHKDNIGPWPQSPAQAHDLVDRGELWFAFTFGGIAEGARDQGKKIVFTIPKEGATPVVDVIQLIKGFSQETTAQTLRFLALFLQDNAQTAFTKNVYTSPVSKTAKIPENLRGREGLLTAQQIESLNQPDLAAGAKKFGDYKNAVNALLKS
jgi:spermidine/putrescine-binding protein